MILSEFLTAVPNGPLNGMVVEAVSLLPDDPTPVWEGDDSIHGKKKGVLALTDPRSLSAALAGPRVVPFVRIVKPRMHGQDVVAFQRALQAAGIRRIRPTGWHGPISVANVKAFQKDNKIAATGVYDKLTHHALLRYFDAYGAWLMMQEVHAERVHQIRAGIVATALFGVSIRDQSHYSQGPHRLDALAAHLKPPKFPVQTDCSGFATWCYQVAGGPDPNGHAFDVHTDEFTGSMAKVGKQVAKPSLADLILYGKPPDFEHVTIFIGNGKCVSDGSEPGPLVLPYDYRPDFIFRTYL